MTKTMGLVSALEEHSGWRRMEVSHISNQTEAGQHRGRWTGPQAGDREGSELRGGGS